MILYLFGVCSTGLAADERVGSIRGYVRDGLSGETLPNANVTIDSLAIGTASNNDGYFVISKIPTGTHTLSISYIGYDSHQLQVDVKAGLTTEPEVELDPVTFERAELIAEGKRVAPTDISPVGSFGTRVTELARIPTVGQPDLMRGIQLLPGVQAASDNSAGLYVRGGTPGQNLILLDGVVVYNPNHLFGFFSTFNPDALKNVLLLKGTFPARYGDRLSSVLDITNLDGNRKNTSVHSSLDMISAGLTAEGPLGDNGSWMVSGRRTYQELINSPLFDHIVDDMFSTRTGTITAAPAAGAGLGGTPGVGGSGPGGGRRFGGTRFNFGATTSSFDQGYNFYDTNFKINMDPSSTDKFSFSGYLGHDKLDLTLPSFGDTERQQAMDWGNQVGSLKWLHVYTDKLLGNVQLSASRYVSNFDVASNQDQETQPRRGFGLNRNNEMLDLSLKVDLDYLATTDHTTRMGFQLTRYDATYWQGFNDSTRSEINSISSYETGYLEQSLRFGRLEMVPGVRFSHFQKGNYTGISPRVAGRFTLNDRISFKAGWGIYHQYINLISVEAASYTTDMWLPVDETLKPGRAVHNAFGFLISPADGWEIDTEFYYKDLENLVEFQSQVRLDESTPLSDLFLQGTGKAYGGEFLLRRTEGRTKGWIGYTLGKTTQTFAELNEGRTFSPKYDRRHDLSIVLNHDLGRGWNINTNWVYGTGQAYTIPESRYEVVQPGGQSITYVHVSEKNAFRLPAYHRMDLGLTKDLRIGSFESQFVLSIFNVYNRRNIWYRSYDANEEEIQFQDVLLQPILPSIGFKFKL